VVGGAAHRGTRWPALLVDLYELTMAQSYLAEGLQGKEATFSVFARTLPTGWGYFVAAGLDDVLGYLEELAFDDGDLAYLESTGLFAAGFLDELARLRFTGDVRALPEGTLFLPHEPVLELTAPIVEAQLAETVVLQELHVQSLVASKAARCVDVARGRTLVDFSLRRTHGADAGMRVARSSFLAGFDATSNVAAGQAYGIPVAGTMAHSFVEAFPDELAGFRAYARSFPERSVLLVDTYDTLEGVRHAATVARELASAGHRLAGIRLDSGDLAALARGARAILDDAGQEAVTIFASGGLDEHDVAALLAAGAPIDGFGIGSKLGTPADAPFLDMAYKLVELDGCPVMKLSPGKATIPGRKQVWRVSSGESYEHDVLGLVDDAPPVGGEPLLVDVMRGGRRTSADGLAASRTRCAAPRERLPRRHHALESARYDVVRTPGLVELGERVASDAGRHRNPG
jgi:nicotinate phosphoribosyltransferase